MSLSYVVVFFVVYSRKENDSNDSVNIGTNDNNSLSRDDIETPNMSESSSPAEFSTDDEIYPSRSDEMSFANTEKISHDHRFFMKEDLKKHILGCFIISVKIGYFCKICEIFYRESNEKPGGSSGHGRMMLLSLKIVLVKSYHVTNTSLTNLKIKGALEKIDVSTNK